MRKLYDALLEKFYMPWAEYVRLNESCGRRVQQSFQSDIYFEVSIELLLISSISLLIYYLYLNNRFGKYYSNRSWFVTFIFNSIIVSVVTYFTASEILANPPCNVSPLIFRISLINLLLALLIFFLLSFIFRQFSLMGKRTPYFGDTTN